MSIEMKNVLFVDDEAMLLKLYDVFFNQKGDKWKTYICSAPNEVNDIIRNNPIDIVVSDYNMKNMDGAEVLKRVVEKFPWVIRIIITASYNEAERLKALNYAHRCMIKPVKLHEMEDEIENAYMIFKSDISRIVRTKITGIDTLPVIPKLYKELTDELKKEDDASLSKIAKMVASDPNMSVNILKIINSPFFTKDKNILKADHAVTMLGLNIVKNLVLSAELIKIFPVTQENITVIDNVIKHSTLCAKLMKQIFKYEKKLGNVTQEDLDLAETIGMLHDVGKIMLASLYPVLYRDINEIKYTSDEIFSELEKHVIGVDHAEVAAYLLSLWGLPAKIPEIIAKHTKISDIHKDQDIFLKAIHFINYVTDFIDTDKDGDIREYEPVKSTIEWYNVTKDTLAIEASLI